MRRVFTFLVALAMLGLTTSALADVPAEMSVQGRLTDGAGAPVPAGLKNFTFKIFDLPAGGIEVWPAGPGELQTLTTDANGLWNAGVGTLIPLTEAVFLSPVRWLEVTVDDGVNPPETLPRIELRTNPYTYRAATSQQADSLAGNSFGDIADMFVDEAGDTMSGQLRIDYPNPGTPDPGLHVLNISGVNGPWLFGNHTFGVAGDATSDGLERKFGAVGIARGAGGDAVGIIGEAYGTGDRNIAVWGATNAAASGDNYSGLFQGGDFEVSSPATPGTAGVVLPSNAIDKFEILDEPGIAFGTSTAGTLLTASGTAQDLVTVSLTLPAPGYVVVQGRVTFRLTGTLLTNFAWMQIDTAAGGASLFQSDFLWVGAFEHAGISNEYHTGSSTRVYNLGAGTYTFRVEGNAYSGNNASADVNLLSSQILATYYPTSYGSVSSAVASAGEFEHAETVSMTDPQSGHTATFYEVDMRELELRAARTQLEAEKAKSALLEARTGVIPQPNRGTGTAGEEANR